MRQKYIISRDGIKSELTIREYAVVAKDLKKVSSSMLQKDNFSFLYKEIYKDEVIVDSISNGAKDLKAILRTPYFFPIEPYISKITESVMTLYNSDDDGPIELFFDDVDLITVDI
jgi:hypothetical protein